jgi:hypothetical protein
MVLGGAALALMLSSAALAVGPRTHEVRWYANLRPCEQGVIYFLETKPATGLALKRKRSEDYTDHLGSWNAYVVTAACRSQGL